MAGKNKLPAIAKKVAASVNGEANAAISGEVISLPSIDPAEKKFVAHYAIFANGAAAVRHAGFELANHKEKAFELLTKSHIQAHVKHLRTTLGEIHFDVGNQIIQQLNRMREADVTEIYDGEGNLRDPKDWPEDVKLLVNGIEIEEEMRGEGDAAYLVRTKKVKLESRKGVMDTLAKILGVLKPDNDQSATMAPTAVIFNVTVGEVKR